MYWVNFRLPEQEADRVGILQGETIRALEVGTTLLSLFGDAGERLATAAERARRDPAVVVRLDQVVLRPPVPRPPTVRDFYAFEQHVRTARARRGLEMEPDWYQLPVFYFSSPYAVCAPDIEVPMAPGTQEWDFELEVAAVVGLGGSDLDPEEAEQHIAGYMIMNDWSARDLQRREMRLSMGPVKGKDTATSTGPMLVTPDELASLRAGKAFDLVMTASVNGREYSRASLADIHWSFGEMLAYASRGTRIEPGDVIGSGTCGTGCILELALVHGGEQYPWLQPGDLVELTVDRLGTLRNRVAAGVPVIPLRHD